MTSLPQIADEMLYMMVFSIIAFLLAMMLTPIYTYFAYKYKFWKKQRSTTTTGEKLEVFNKLHAHKFNGGRKFPTMAGIIGVITIAVITFAFNLDRSQTWLPLAALIGGGIVGLLDDIINIFGHGKGVAGLRSGAKFTMIAILGLAIGWWCYERLGIDYIFIPYFGEFFIGWLTIPFFAFAIVATGNAVNITDGLDGLAGGLLILAYGSFASIALLQGNLGMAEFAFTVVGALLAYVWFNIYPARFMMGDVGSFAFGTTLAVLAILTNSILLIPIIGFLFVVEAGSSAIQILSKKILKRKIFVSAPIHHHLEARGWEETKITMRFWIIGAMTAFFGLVVALTGGII
ncbi:phospho-N-acetylmuramoyl-pentapeptide-transferase [Candidatus Saccharibacteria bacterium]|nr:phospho-N-acetylmuramoyl-pentapeptide-transferase [Candidatus Saccharibacteria bacterium]